MSMQEQFNQFYAKIKLTPKQTEDAKKKYTGVCTELHNCYYPNTKYGGNTKLLIGSYGKKTHIRPPRDVDVLFVMPEEQFRRYSQMSNGQSQLLQDVRKILEKKYPDSKINADRMVVAVKFAQANHNVEVMPAWENMDGTFTVPNSKQGGRWESSDPRSEIKEIEDSNSRTRKTRMLIRMVKKWQDNCTVGLRSYPIEQAVLGFFQNSRGKVEADSDLVMKFFAYFYQKETDVNNKSHLKTAANRAEKACEFEEIGDIKKATGEWRKIFGDDFPASSVIAKSTLGDYSHCEKLKWALNISATLSIDAYASDASGRKRPISSDGQSLPAGLKLQFVANCHKGGTLEYYWQVVNTGEEAIQAGDLRGDILKGERTWRENTKYAGRHWIESFVVQNGVCIARKKFIVNIAN